MDRFPYHYAVLKPLVHLIFLKSTSLFLTHSRLPGATLRNLVDARSQDEFEESESDDNGRRNRPHGATGSVISGVSGMSGTSAMTSFSSGSVSSTSVGSLGSSMSTNTTFSSLGSWLSELEPGADAAADAAGAGQRKAFGGENSERSSGSMSRWNGFSNGLVPQELDRLRYNRWRDAMDLLVAIGWLECKGGQCFGLSAAVPRPLQDIDSRAAMVSCCKSLSTTCV